MSGLELVIVLAVLGILMAIGAVRMAPSGAQLAANSVQGFVQQARFEAIKTNRPIVVAFADADRTVQVRTSLDAGTVSCSDANTSAVRSLDLSEYRNVGLDSSAARFVWLPNGQARGCGGEWLDDEVTVALDDGKGPFEVLVGRGGEVTVR